MTIMIGCICTFNEKFEDYNKTCFVSWNKKQIKVVALNERLGFIEEFPVNENLLTPIAGFQSDLLPLELVTPHQLVLKNPKKKKNTIVKFKNEDGEEMEGIISSKTNGILTIDNKFGTFKVNMNLVDLA